VTQQEQSSQKVKHATAVDIKEYSQGVMVIHTKTYTGKVKQAPATTARISPPVFKSNSV